MKTRYVVLTAFALVAASLVASTVAMARIPERPPVHRVMLMVGPELGQNMSPTTYGANLQVPKDRLVVVVVYNFTDKAHTVTSKALGFSVKVPAAQSARNGMPSRVIFNFTPKKAGTYRWHSRRAFDKETTGTFTVTNK